MKSTFLKLGAFTLVSVMLLSLFACQNGNGNETTGTDGTTIEETTADQTDATTGGVTDATTEVTTEVTTTQTIGEQTTTEETTEATTETVVATTEATTDEITTETEIDLDVYAVFDGNFTLKGDMLSYISTALDEAGISKGKFGAANSIVVGNHTAALLQTAKTDVAGRENNYNDFTVLCDGKTIAIYGGSTYAVQEAIEYVMDNYVKGNALVIPKDLSYSYKPEVSSDITIGGVALSEVSVICDVSSYEGAASSLVEMLSRICGKKLSLNNADAAAKIVLVPTNTTGENNFSLDYTVAVEGTTLTITAPTRASLSNATLNFLSVLTQTKTFDAGYSKSLTCELAEYKANDVELFKYCGTWQATDAQNPTTMVSYWDSAFVEVDFTGNAITLMFSTPTTFMYKLDGRGSYKTVSSATEYTVFADGDGDVHTIRILYNDKSRHMYFAGVKVEKNATVSRTPKNVFNIQFVGDSISDATNSFSHESAERLGWDYSVIACQALSLVRNSGYWRYNNGFSNESGYKPGSMAALLNKNFNTVSIGMEDAFFKLGIPDAGNPAQGSEEFNDIAENYFTDKYNFKNEINNSPDIVFIFLGTNDLTTGSNENQVNAFVSSYKSFVANILEFYGEDTKICIMQALSTSNSSNLIDKNDTRYKAIDRAAAELIELYPDNVTYIDSDTVISWNVQISSDATHPSTEGYATLTSCVAAFLDETYGN